MSRGTGEIAWMKRGIERGNGVKRGTRGENRKTKPFRRRLGNGTSRSAMAQDAIFARIELLIAKVQHQNVGYVDTLYIFRFGCGNKKTIRYAGSVTRRRMDPERYRNIVSGQFITSLSLGLVTRDRRNLATCIIGSVTFFAINSALFTAQAT